MLFNDIYDIGEIPIEWCESIICHIHKSGPQTIPRNYRGLSLINTISKIFTSVLTIRLQNWTEENEILDEAQASHIHTTSNY